mgnify:CR=1 FL=1
MSACALRLPVTCELIEVASPASTRNHTISDHKQVSEGTEEQKQSTWNNGDDYAWLI